MLVCLIICIFFFHHSLRALFITELLCKEQRQYNRTTERKVDIMYENIVANYNSVCISNVDLLSCAQMERRQSVLCVSACVYISNESITLHANFPNIHVIFICMCQCVRTHFSAPNHIIQIACVYTNEKYVQCTHIYENLLRIF